MIRYFIAIGFWLLLAIQAQAEPFRYPVPQAVQDARMRSRLPSLNGMYQLDIGTLRNECSKGNPLSSELQGRLDKACPLWCNQEYPDRISSENIDCIGMCAGLPPTGHSGASRDSGGWSGGKPEHYDCQLDCMNSRKGCNRGCNVGPSSSNALCRTGCEDTYRYVNEGAPDWLVRTFHATTPVKPGRSCNISIVAQHFRLTYRPN